MKQLYSVVMNYFFRRPWHTHTHTHSAWWCDGGAFFHMNPTFHIETNYVMLCEYLSSQKLQNVPVDVSWNCVLGCYIQSVIDGVEDDDGSNSNTTSTRIQSNVGV